jgi:hypothetical protein
MARLPRLVVPNQLHHVIAQGHNDQPIVRDDADHQAFLTWLREALGSLAWPSMPMWCCRVDYSCWLRRLMTQV